MIYLVNGWVSKLFLLKEIKKISGYSIDRLQEMHQEMNPVLEHNYKLIKLLTPNTLREKFQ